jgi:para-nitrobenzyl esterase
MKGASMQLVKTDKGYVSGTIIGEPGKEVSVFRGIPYAAPPVGDLRWRPPQPVTAWKGIRECTRFSAFCPQPVTPNMPPGPMNEDCLYLNVVTPAKKTNEKYPVMVWMHGGGYGMGSGNDAIWNSYHLPQKGVVIVTITQRLNVFGLMSHPELTAESPNHASGNYLFLDLIAALQWVQKNIAAFGGDPKNVTIFGESGGGAKVSIMMSSPLAKGLFHRAICESGTATAFLPAEPIKTMEIRGEKLFAAMGVKTLAEARRLPWEKVLQANQSIETPATPGKPPSFYWGPTLDGWMLPKSPIELFKSGDVNAVPLITLACLGELTGPGPLVMPQIIPAYVEMMEAVNRKGFNAYACIFDYVPQHWREEGGVSAHSTELTYVFGDTDNSSGWWDSIIAFMQISGAKSKELRLGPSEKAVSEAMMKLWAQFAKNGKPSVKGVVDWPVYDKAGDKYLYINEPLEVRTGFSKLAQKQV